MRKLMIGLAVLTLAASPALGALRVGAKAPDFVTTGAIAGKPFRLHLAEQLRSGPVVLYFFPKSFTKGCTLEAHAFSESAAEFKKAGARVIGMSGDNLETLKRFSVEECRGAFPVATATRPIIKSYDVAMPLVSAITPMTKRTSYVIARNGRVAFVHSELDWSKHVQQTLAAVKTLKR